jgi:MFS family permease
VTPRPPPKPNGWLARVLVINLLQAAVVHGMRPIVSYRALALGGGPLELGLVAASYGVLSLIIAVPAGRWVDRWGQAPFIAAGTAVVGLSALLVVLSESVPVLAVAMATLGVGQILSAVSFQTMLASGGAPEGRDGRFGAQTVVASFGQLIGPAAAGLLVGEAIRSGESSGATLAPHTTDGAFWVGAFAALVASAVACSLWRWPPPVHAQVTNLAASQDARGTMRHVVRRVLRVPSMPQAFVASLTVLSSVDILVAYLPAYGVANGIPVETVGILLAVRGGASMLSRSLMLPLRRLLGRRRLLVVSMVLPAVALCLLPLAGADVGLLAGMLALIGFGLGLGQPLTMSWVASRAPAEVRGTAMGVRLGANRIGQLGLPVTVALIAGAAGLPAIFWSLGGLLALSALLVARAPFGVASNSAAPVVPGIDESP